MNSIFGNELIDDFVHKELVPLSHPSEKGSKWILQVDLPGVKKKDIKVSLTSDHIVIKAKLEESYCVSRRNCVVEFDYFKKVVELPSSVDTKNISAEFKGGILTIVMPKATTGKRIPLE
jgi:HSP20 family protein